MAKVKVSEKVLEGLNAVRESGLTNMFNSTAVKDIASQLGYKETADWVLTNRGLYTTGVMQGFEAE